MHRILLADDDRALCNLLADFLAGDGFVCESVHDGQKALMRALTEPFDALVLDVMMPGLNGFEVLRRLRKERSTPVLMLTARGEETDSIVGLEIGADDYLAKPCSPQLLAARLRAVLRRSGGEAKARSSTDPITIADVTLSPGALTVTVAGREVTLTGAEFKVLQLLMRQAGSVVTKDFLCLHALGRKQSPYDRSIDMHISGLRRKLGPDAGGQPRIRTLRGAGYLYALPLES